MVAITYGLFERATAFRSPHLPKIPHAPAAIGDLQLPPSLTQAQHQLVRAQYDLSQAQHQLAAGTLAFYCRPS